MLSEVIFQRRVEFFSPIQALGCAIMELGVLVWFPLKMKSRVPINSQTVEVLRDQRLNARIRKSEFLKSLTDDVEGAKPERHVREEFDGKPSLFHAGNITEFRSHFMDMIVHQFRG